MSIMIDIAALNIFYSHQSKSFLKGKYTLKRTLVEYSAIINTRES